MLTNNKTYSSLSSFERVLLVRELQARRALLKDNATRRQKRASTGNKKKEQKQKKFAFDDPKMQAMFDMLPKDFKKKFGIKA